MKYAPFNSQCAGCVEQAMAVDRSQNWEGISYKRKGAITIACHNHIFDELDEYRQKRVAASYA